MTHQSFFKGKIITFIFIQTMSHKLLVQMASQSEKGLLLWELNGTYNAF